MSERIPTHAALDHAVSLDAWRAAAAALGLAPAQLGGRLAWCGVASGHEVTIAVDPAGTERAFVTVVLKNSALTDALVVTPIGLSLAREGRFLTGDIALDRKVVIQGRLGAGAAGGRNLVRRATSLTELAAPWDAAARAAAHHLVGELGAQVIDGAMVLGPHATARATAEQAVPATLDHMMALANRLVSDQPLGEQLEAIATADPSPAVRALYAQILADEAPTGALGEERAQAAIASIDQRGDSTDDTFETLLRAAKSSPTAQVREQALVKLLGLYPLARVEPLLLDTEDTLGVRVREALVAAMHRATPPFSPLALLRLMARTPIGPSGLQAAAAALGASQDPAALARVASLVQHPDEPVWTTAVIALLSLASPPSDVVNALDKAARDDVFDRLPSLVLERRPPRALPILQALTARWSVLGHARAAAYEAALLALAAPVAAASAEPNPPENPTS